jgi:hypothetical protein
MTSRRKYSGRPGDDQLAAWKQAITAQRRQQRARRWKRSEPKITGIRIPAPTDSQEQVTNA